MVEVVPPSEAANDSDVNTVELNALQVEAIMFGVPETEGLTHCPPGYRRVDSSSNGPAPELYTDFKRLQNSIFEAYRRVTSTSDRANSDALKKNMIEVQLAKHLRVTEFNDEKIDELGSSEGGKHILLIRYN